MEPSSKFSKYVFYSLAFHVVVFVIFLIVAAYSPVRKIPETKITMVRLGPKLGVPKGAPEAPPGIPETPKKISDEPPPIETKAPEKKIPTPPKVTEKPKPKPKAKPKAPTQKPPTSKVKITQKKPPVKTKPVKKPDEAEMAKALSGIDEQLEDRKRQMEAAPPTAGNPGQPTTGQAAQGSPTGNIQARDPGFAAYQGRVRSRIIRNWVRTSSGGQTKRLSARIRVRINASGAVISKSFAKRSGDPAFDASAMRAVERASPLPAPPAGVKGEALREGFVVHFRARVVGQN